MKNSRKGRLYRQLLTATLLIGGTFNLVAPAIAAGTAAGTNISNTATGTYLDPSDTTNTPINTTSNTVTITVAEVAGIDVSANSQPSNASPGGNLTYDYKITNSGNDPTKFVLPTKATLSGSGAASGTVSSIVLPGADGQFGTSDDVNISTNTTAYVTPSVAAGQFVLVRVNVAVSASAPGGQTITVEYGKTTTPGSTNQTYAANTDSSNTPLDIVTQDNADTDTVSGEAAGAPVNGQREDSATLDGTIGTVLSVANGPSGQPAAVGPDGTTNTDFTNKSSPVPANTAPGTTIDPAVVTFTNTLNNTANAQQTFTIAPDPRTLGTSNLPNGTTVTISATGATPATYTWNATSKTFTTTGTPVTVTLAQGATAPYTVAVDLPVGTKLSTDLTTAGNLNSPVGGYAVPITAYADTNNNGLDANDPQNTTIDRTYAGYLVLFKEAQIYDGNGNVVQAYTTDQTLLAPKFVAGNSIQYRIQYKNISESNGTGGANNGALNANTVKITEDGTLANSNWAKDNDGNGTIDTSHYSAADSNGFTITPTPTTTAPTKYEDNVGTLAPQGTGNMIIRRTIN
jgi:hypothetical protein